MNKPEEHGSCIHDQLSAYLLTKMSQFFLLRDWDEIRTGAIFQSNRYVDILDGFLLSKSLGTLSHISDIIHYGHCLDTINNILFNSWTRKGFRHTSSRVEWLGLGTFEMRYIDERFAQIEFNLDNHILDFIRRQLDTRTIGNEMLDVLLSEKDTLDSGNLTFLLRLMLDEEQSSLRFNAQLYRRCGYIDNTMPQGAEDNLARQLSVLAQLWGHEIAKKANQLYKQLLTLCFMLRKTITMQSFGTFTWNGIDYTFSQDREVIRYLKANLRGHKQNIFDPLLSEV